MFFISFLFINHDIILSLRTGGCHLQYQQWTLAQRTNSIITVGAYADLRRCRHLKLTMVLLRKITRTSTSARTAMLTKIFRFSKVKKENTRRPSHLPLRPIYPTCPTVTSVKFRSGSDCSSSTRSFSSLFVM